MTGDEYGLMDWGFKGLAATLFAIGGWGWTMLFKTTNKTRDDLAEHKLHISQNYALKMEMNTSRVELSNTLKRVHERIDGIYDILQDNKKG